jgi:GNAT superfamily N-acetyltransferase
MPPLQQPRHTGTVRDEIRDLVAERGEIDLDEARRALGVGSPAFETAVMELVDDGELAAATDGVLRFPESASTPSSTPSSEIPAQRHTVGDMTYRIDPVGPSQADCLLAAVRETEGVLPKVDGVPLTRILREERDDDDLAVADGKGYSFLVTVDGADLPVAWAHVRSREDAGRCRTAWVAVDVRRPHRRRGLGCRLLVRCVGWAAANGYDRLYTTVEPVDDNTVAFLRHHGWETKTLCVENREVVAAKLEVTL